MSYTTPGYGSVFSCISFAVPIFYASTFSLKTLINDGRKPRLYAKEWKVVLFAFLLDKYT